MPLLSEEDLAGQLQVDADTLRRWRLVGEGPKFVKLGRLVRYDENDVAEWIRANRRQSTKDGVNP